MICVTHEKYSELEVNPKMVFFPQIIQKLFSDFP